ncbi:MAG: hypothetical protein BHW53_00700 [Ruminococcus sp. CAG:108-related_41_35]|nr:MAG: hypothetical protein BHW53_00700 [Ruminococcus sp. CAG:108-related_41_35]
MERFRQRYGIALTKKKLQEIILMLMALEAVFAFSYLGYIELPAISTTTLHILVIVAAWSGTKVGTLSISSGCAFAGDHPDFSVEICPCMPGNRNITGQRNCPLAHPSLVGTGCVHKKSKEIHMTKVLRFPCDLARITNLKFFTYLHF